MKFISKTLFVILCATTAGCKSETVDKSAYWRSMVSQVSVGMKRSDVEQLLPPKISGIEIGTGSRQMETYCLDKTWQISITYDHAGVPRDEKGTALKSTSPDNRVLSIPSLSKRTGH
jgi:hypothetical protein